MTDPIELAHRRYVEWRMRAAGFPAKDAEVWMKSPTYRGDVETVFRAIEEAGYVVVPREPTEAMTAGAYEMGGVRWGYDAVEGDKYPNDVWRAMIEVVHNQS